MRRRMFLTALAAALGAGPAMAGGAGERVIDDFSGHPETRWRFYTDAVMGGVSTGALVMLRGAGGRRARMTGVVSTAHQGGFLQMRRDLDPAPPAGTVGVWIEVRGNGERYFVHLHTRQMLFPWQYYQAPFESHRDWRRIALPFSAFHPSGRMLRAVPRPQDLLSVALVAYGRDHTAEMEVRAIGFY
ncbi:CIA30 family protein [Rhodobacter maris]|uniref:Complex I intermediate-associated protein 30 (CIA30) n=1 Tax=Rhodobacter maris TaxID=446682 RepID=A0A285TBP8_9RHOB|nr:CIA30 family protein [Rhodobacter maris]SOC19175.1 complex I intermediate-associated protein 30 (CIA30) [Rhodobacter maris]